MFQEGRGVRGDKKVAWGRGGGGGGQADWRAGSEQGVLREHDLHGNLKGQL